MGNQTSERPSESQLGCCTRQSNDFLFEDAESARGCKVLLAATELFQVMGFSAYHTSITLDGRELFFDGGGVVEADAFWSHDWCQGVREKASSGEPVSKREVVDLGRTHLDREAVMDVIGPYFQAGSYDVLRKNCNSFSDAAIYFLTKQRLEGRFNRLERMVTALEPVSTDIIKRLMTRPPANKSRESGRAVQKNASPDGSEDYASAECEDDFGYVANPFAKDFSVEEVVAACNALDARN
ncbi:unnamed protein product, partial [Polarella glacialis]